MSARRVWIAGGVALGIGTASLLAVGPLVRRKVATTAADKHLTITVGSVRPGVFAVHLGAVSVTAEDLPGVTVTLDQVDIDLSAALAAKNVHVHGGRIEISGSPDELRERMQHARERMRANSPASDAGGGRSLQLEGLQIVWNSGAIHAEIHDVALTRDATGTTATAGHATLQAPEGQIDLTALKVGLSPEALLQEASAATVALLQEASVTPEPEPPKAPFNAPAPVPAQGSKHTQGSAPLTPAVANGPLVRFPDLKSVRHRVQTAQERLSALLPEGAHIDVAKFSVQIPGTDGLTIGPGPLSIAHAGERTWISFKTESDGASVPLSVALGIPAREDQDLTLALDGGPIRTVALGLRNGTAGVLDADKATIVGKAQVTLGNGGDSLVFDGRMQVKGLGLKAPRLSSEDLHGLDLGIVARGALEHKKDASGADNAVLRLDDFDASLGAFHFGGSGTLEARGDHLSLQSSFAIPTANCDAILKSFPDALLPTLRGTSMQGTLTMQGRLGFDSDDLDKLDLHYDVDDRCKAIAVPEALTRTRFTRPFSHTVYKPDGSRVTATTGPGSDNWTELERISPYMQVAVLTTEDGTFRRHHGFNHQAIQRALISNLKARRFAQGASTISMQLTKNLFLTRDKTLSRKLEEIVLTSYMEQIFDKDELIELYLNIIEFGPNIYGITEASRYYYGRNPEELNLAECMFLATLLPAPVRLSQVKSHGELPPGQLRTVQTLMKAAEKTGKISPAELAEGLKETVVFQAAGAPRPAPRPPQRGSRFEGNETENDSASWAPIEPEHEPN